MSNTGIRSVDAAAIPAAFGLSGHARILEGVGGTAGASAVIVDGDRRYVLRCRSLEHASKDSIAFEHALLHHLAERGLPVGAPVRTLGGASYAESGGRVFELFPFIAGEPFDPTRPAQLREVAATAARLHRATAGFRRAKPSQGREDEPAGLLRELPQLLPADLAGGAVELLREVRACLAELDGVLGNRVYGRLPEVVVHGDLHPGNVRFRGDRVAGLFDFDWANRRERIRDVGDCILFFAGRRDNGLEPGDIWSLTQGIRLDADRVAQVLAGYGPGELAAEELQYLPAVMAARWLQVRIRGMRKVPQRRRYRFLDRGDLLTTLRRIRRLDLRELSRSLLR